jgi:SAM-dependent methyltransferase
MPGRPRGAGVSVFDQYSRYYDLIYHDKDYGAEADYIATLLHRFVPTAHDLLEFGSGTGVHGRLLADKGYRVFGIERSPEMIAQALRSVSTPTGSPKNSITTNHQSGSFDCLEGDIRYTSIDRTFDAILALFHVISYQTSDADIIATFNNAHRHLQPGGIFLFDVWYTPAVLFQRPAIRIKRVEDEQIRLIRLAEPTLFPNKNMVEVHYTILAEEIATHCLTTIEETHRIRHFSLPEVEMLVGITGFTLLHSEEFLTANPPGEETWGVCFVLRRD